MKAEKIQSEEKDTLDVLVNHIWKSIVRHSRKGHRLRLVIEDEEQTLWCVWCHSPLAGGSHDVMKRCGERMKATGIGFEVEMFTLHNHH